MHMGFIPAAVLDGLKYIEPLRYGQCSLPEGKPRNAVASDVLGKTLAELAPTWRKIVSLQLATAARPSEILNLKIQEIDRGNPELWVAELKEHKNAHRGQIRRLFFAKPEIAVLREVIGERTDGFVFTPAMLVSDDKEKRAAKAVPRKKQPSRLKRDAARSKHPKLKINEVIDPAVYRRAVSRACIRAGVPNWTPYEIRHTGITRIAIEKGLDTARAVAGQRTISITAGYNHGDSAIAAAVALERNRQDKPEPAAPDNAYMIQMLKQQNEMLLALLQTRAGS
ncbi:hypothetical protein FACS1894170_12010 [Planctomycetales bacterium]|nr:hypothetical protein FACS1894170_12010 [Planctomycetales bacterium]